MMNTEDDEIYEDRTKKKIKYTLCASIIMAFLEIYGNLQYCKLKLL